MKKWKEESILHLLTLRIHEIHLSVPLLLSFTHPADFMFLLRKWHLGPWAEKLLCEKAAVCDFHQRTLAGALPGSHLQRYIHVLRLSSCGT